MTHQLDYDKVTRNIELKSARNFSQLIPDLVDMGYLDQDQQPKGAGVHLVPLLQKTLIALETVFQISLQAHSDDLYELEPKHDIAETMMIFHTAAHKAVAGLEKSNFKNPKDHAFELRLPTHELALL